MPEFPEFSEKISQVTEVQKLKEKLETDIETLRDPERGYMRAGYPKFMRLFGRDSLIVSWQLLDTYPEIARATLDILSKFQGKKFNEANEEEPGKILHETEPGLTCHPKIKQMYFPYYGSVDSTPLFLIIFAFYFEKTHDRNFLSRYRLNIEAAANWLEQKMKKDSLGFLRYRRKRKEGQLFHQGWKDSFSDHLKIKPPVAIVEAQGYSYLALKQTAKLLKNPKYNQLAEKLKSRFSKKFWIKNKKYFALAIDGNSQQCQAITSNPGHLLFTEILDQNKARKVVKRLFQTDLWTNYGIRTHSMNNSNFDWQSYHHGSVWPHDNWIIAQGLKKLGFISEYQKVKNAVLNAYKKLNYIPELCGVTPKGKLKEILQACRLQAWASGAALSFLNEKQI